MKSVSRSLNFLIAILLALSIGLQNVGAALADGLTDQNITVDTVAPAGAAYGESFTVAASASSGLDVSYSSSGSCTNVGAEFTMSAGSGTCTLHFDQAGDTTYNPAPQVNEDVTAQLAAVTVTADPQGKTYRQDDPALTYKITSGALVGPDGFTGALARDGGEAVGDYAITQGTLALSADYDLTYSGANLTIGQAAITVTADAQSKLVGASDPALTYKVTSGALVSPDEFTGALARDPGETAGDYPITQGTLALSGNYELSFIGANLSITAPGSLTISGNAGVAGATLSYTGGTPVTAGDDGHYSLTVPHNWSGTVTPGKTGYSFSPASKDYAGVVTDQTQDYTASAVTYTISGNAGVGAATLSYTGGTPVTAGDDGHYTITVPYNWSGTVTPSRTGYSFSPASKDYSGVLTDQTEDYTLVGLWFVAPAGLDANNCASIAATCLTINAALSKAATGDTILVAGGTYTGITSPVVSVNKDINLSGGWDAAFGTRSGISVIDGQDARAGIVVSAAATVTIERFSITNSGTSGINNQGTLMLRYGMLYANNKPSAGGNSLTSGGGIYNSGTLTIISSSIYDNFASGQSGGGIYNAGSLVIRNATIASNSATNGGGIMYTPSGHVATAPALWMNNVTLAENTASYGGGIYRAADIAPVLLEDPIFQNSILAGNTAGSNQNCYGSINSANNNLINPNSGCTVSGTYINASPLLSAFSAGDGYMALLSGSPAIDAGSPAAPGSGGTACESVDQVGNPRPMDGNGDAIAVCDMGAYEDHSAGVPAFTISGSADMVGVTLSYTDGVSKTAFSDESGNYAFMVSDGWSGTVRPSKTGYVFVPSETNYVNVKADQTSQNYTAVHTWYVTTTGSDSNSCTSVTTPCGTLPGALGKAAAGGSIQVAAGIYVGNGAQVLLINKDINLSGGWDLDFTHQPGTSTLDGQAWQADLLVTAGVTVTLDRFTITGSKSSGIVNAGILTLQDSDIFNNNKPIGNVDSVAFGGGIDNSGTLTVIGSTIHDNYAAGRGGGGIYNAGKLVIQNSTITRNHADYAAGILYSAIGYVNTSPSLELNNVTIADNASSSGAGIYRTANRPPVLLSNPVLQNSILALNSGQDCHGTVVSLGHNLIGNTTGCGYIAGVGDKINVVPRLGQLTGVPGYLPLLLGSPALNAGNPVTCLPTDQRGMTRPQGSACDIGAYEYRAPGAAALIGIMAGSSQSQSTAYNQHFTSQLAVYVTDRLGSPVTGIKVTFTAPSSGATATFGSTGSHAVTVVTDSSGRAFAPAFTANNYSGTYDISASVVGVSSPAIFALTNLPVPTPSSPKGTLTNITQPTYQWPSLADATQYQYELWKENSIIYTQTLAAIKCDSRTCSHKPAIGLSYAGYRWRVQAMVGGVWQAFSAYNSFTLTFLPRTGFWRGSGVEFYLKLPLRQVYYFAVYIYVNGCGSYKITEMVPVYSTRTGFNFLQGGFYGSGIFSSPTVSSGKVRFISYLIPGCGYVSGGPFAWTAVWRSKSMSSPAVQLEMMPLKLLPGLDGSSNLLTVEPVKP